MDFDTALEQFGRALGNLKRAYADEYNVVNPSYISILVDDDDYVTILDTTETGHYLTGAHRERVDTWEE